MLAHHPPRPPGVAPAPAIPPGRVSSADSRRRRTRWPTAWPSGCSASPSKTGTSPVTARRSLPARDCWMGVTPQRRGRWGCTSPSSPMPIEACRDGGSLPATAKERRSASGLRRPWHNRKRSRDMRNRRRAHRNAVSVHEHPDVGCARTDRHRPRASGGQNGPPESRWERHSVKPSIIASAGAVGSATSRPGRAQGPQPRARRRRARRRGDRRRRMGRAMRGTGPGNPDDTGDGAGHRPGVPGSALHLDEPGKRPAPPFRTPPPGTVRRVSSATASSASAGLAPDPYRPGASIPPVATLRVSPRGAGGGLCPL